MTSGRSAPTFRFAPSPNGYLHRGHAFSALLNARAAARNGGRFLVRIENIDPVRSSLAFEAAILEDLAWIGLEWEQPILRQSGRFEAYAAALSELHRLELLYPAFMSRGEIAASVAASERTGKPWPRDPDGSPHYPGQERSWSERRRRAEIESGRPYALRLDMGRVSSAGPVRWRECDPLGDMGPHVAEAHPSDWGDIVLARRETPASYNLCVVVDDAHQQITHVMRGEDLRAATSVQRLLQTLLRLPEPLYFHHPLILDETGQKLSKSRGSKTLRDMRRAGVSPAALLASLPL